MLNYDPPPDGVEGLLPDPALDAAREELLLLEEELTRRRFLDDGPLWAEVVLKRFLWSKQREILNSIRDNRKTAVKSCHGPGKSFTAATAVAWWIATHLPGEAVVVTSAPTGRQVKAILWKEIGRAHALGGLPGRTNQTEWYITLAGKEELVAFGQKPSDLDPSAFQGHHAKALLVVFDEADGMPQSLSVAADSLMTNDAARRLDIGNPDTATSEFAKACRPGSGWNVISIPAFLTPNFTGEPIPPEVASVLVDRAWVEDFRRTWAPRWRWSSDGRLCLPPTGEDRATSADPFWFSKVMAEFPDVGGPQSLIPQAWIAQAQERNLQPGRPEEFGVDVGAGGDSSTVGLRRGGLFRIIHEDHNPDTMQTCGTVISLRKDHSPGAPVKVDKIGIGAGLVDRANEQKENFLGINVGLPASDPEKFANFKAEAWWTIREQWFASGRIAIDPLDDRLASELASLRYKRTSRGQIQIESKEEAMRRGVASPNRAEALMLAFCTPPAPEKKKKAGLVW